VGRPRGRHFLRPADAYAIVDAAGIRPGELVLDLGAGDGALTEPLLRAGARVVAVEVDRRALHRLHERFDGDDRATIVDGDLLQVPLPRRPYRVVANLPFATTSAALRRLLDPRSNLRRADVVVQRGAAVAWATEPRRHPSRHFHVRLGPTVRRSSFVPPPSVDGAVLVVTRHR
jgi:23S rRNA (adenine-N6)-dimethyltransferase